MMTGDAYRVPLQIETNEGFLTSEDLEDIEVFIGSIRKTLQQGDVTYDLDENVFLVALSQRETFRLKGEEKVQARCKFLSGDVIGVDFGTIDVKKSTSKVVL